MRMTMKASEMENENFRSPTVMIGGERGDGNKDDSKLLNVRFVKNSGDDRDLVDSPHSLSPPSTQFQTPVSSDILFSKNEISSGNIEINNNNNSTVEKECHSNKGSFSSNSTSDAGSPPSTPSFTPGAITTNLGATNTTATTATTTSTETSQPTINIISDISSNDVFATSFADVSVTPAPSAADTQATTAAIPCRPPSSASSSSSSSSSTSSFKQLVIEDNQLSPSLSTCCDSPGSDSALSANCSDPIGTPIKLPEPNSPRSSPNRRNPSVSNDNFELFGLNDFGSNPPPPSPIDRQSTTPRGSIVSVISAASVSARLKARKRPGNFFMNMIAPTYRSKLYDFRAQLGPQLPNIRSERLIGDYACAYHKDFLIQGRIYITKNYVIFYANWIGFYEKIITLQCKEIESISKGYTAIVIPNAIHLTTFAGVKHVFASFVQRDKTFHLIQKICARAKSGDTMTDEEIGDLIRDNYGEVVSDSSDDQDDQDQDSIDISASTDQSKGMFSIVQALVATEDLMIEPEKEEAEKDGTTITESNLDDDNNNLDNQSGHQATATQQTNSNGSSSRESSPQISSPKDSKRTNSISPTTVKLLPISFSSSNSVSSSNSSSSTSSPTSSKNSTSSLSPPVSPSSSSAAIPAVLGPLNCLCATHAKTKILHHNLPYPVDQLYKTIFLETDFCQKLHYSRKTFDLKLSEWVSYDQEKHKIDSLGDIVIAADPIRHRSLSYTINVNTALLKTAFTKDSQFVFQQDPGRAYVVASQTRNMGIPYAESFFVNSTTCLVADPVNPNTHTNYSVHYNIVYVKANWSLNMIKGTIEKSSLHGLTTYSNDVINFIPKYFELNRNCDKSCVPSTAGSSEASLLIVPGGGGSSEDDLKRLALPVDNDGPHYRKSSSSNRNSKSLESDKSSRDRIGQSRSKGGTTVHDAHSVSNSGHHSMLAPSCNLYLLLFVLIILVVMVVINIFLLFHISDIESKLSQLYLLVTQAYSQQQNGILLANQQQQPQQSFGQPAPAPPPPPPSTEL